MKTALLTALAMVAFAANSLLCRQALGAELIDAASFTVIRVAAGALTLGLLMLPTWRQSAPRPHWPSAWMLFFYMVFFSFAYLSLSAGTGALLLFGAVQVTMFTAALRDGEHFSPASWFGLLAALAGMVYLVSPGITAPEPAGAALMVCAGIAWGGYSLLGRGVRDATGATASNFLFCLPLAMLTGAFFIGSARVTGTGMILAIASGALASGLGYAIWYAALRGLQAGRAATVQLSVPVIAAIGGVVFLAEEMTFRLGLATALTIGGVGVVLSQRGQPAAR
ncbi:MAG: DMT family transporter [Pseudomonadota bacterium]